MTSRRGFLRQASALAVLSPLTSSAEVGTKQSQGSGTSGFARATDVETLEIYHAAQRPGWACWPTAWQDPQGGVYVAFQELRRAPNSKWQPPPLSFWESIGLPASYQVTLCGGTKEIVPESVVMKSADGCKTWKEVGRDDARATTSFGWNMLPDGRLIRVVSNDYLAWGTNLPPRTYSEISSDGGRTWTQQRVLLENYATDVGAYRLRILGDGTVAALCGFHTAWQPGQERFGRSTKRPYVRQEFSNVLWFSKDHGETWTALYGILPGVLGWEADFCELPSGDLLVANSSVQGGLQARQHIRKTKHGWVPGPVIDVVSGRVPERLAYRKDGVIVGAVRGGGYFCSNDEGATWHSIDSAPTANYQPFTLPLHDGRFLTVWHAGGGDEPFGKKDLWIGAHVFRLAGNLPKPTRLALARQLDLAGDRYINAFTAQLTCGPEPVAGKIIRYSYKKRYTKTWVEGTVTTNAQGQARIDLVKEFESETNIHLSYEIKAWFEPQAGDRELAPCRSDEYFAYALTASRKDLGW